MSTEATTKDVYENETDRIAALDPKERPLQETPRHTCALGGAVTTASAIRGVVPILHAGGGCGWANFWGFQGGSGGGRLGDGGAMMTPCTCLLEKHVVFGGEERLRDQIRSTFELMKGDLFVTITGCIPSLIGDDVESVVAEFRKPGERPIVCVKSAGFSGTSYEGYEWFLDAIIDQYLEPQPIEPKLVNILGIQPCQHVFWKGDLKEHKFLLGGLGLDVNPIFADLSGIEGLRRIPAAALNIVVNPWQGIEPAKRLQEKFGTPFVVYEGTPVGPDETTHYLRFVAEHLPVEKNVLEDWITARSNLAYQDFGYISTNLYQYFCNVPFAVAADSSIAIGITRYLTNECGLLPAVVILTDNPPEESRPAIIKRLTENLEGVVVPDVFVENDTYLIHEKLKNYSFMFLFASSMEKYAAKKFMARPHTVSFPAFDRLILKRTYAGFDGGTALIEDLLTKFARPL